MKWQPTPVFWPGKFHGQRSLANYHPWDDKESDTTERLSMHAIYSTHNLGLPDCPYLPRLTFILLNLKILHEGSIF